MSVRDLTKQQLSELMAVSGRAPKHQTIAVGSRLLLSQIRKTAGDIKPFALVCIRMQTFFRGPGFPGNQG